MAGGWGVVRDRIARGRRRYGGAFAYALLRCGTRDDLTDKPWNRLRLTVGLVKREGCWAVQHEHHSFPHDDDPPASAAAVEAEQERWTEQTASKDLDGLMEAISADVVSYEHETPLQYVGVEEVRQVCLRGLESATGEISFTTPDRTVVAREDLAISWGLDRVVARDTAGGVVETWSRGTRVFRRQAGAWTMVHQHLSFPDGSGNGRGKDGSAARLIVCEDTLRTPVGHRVVGRVYPDGPFADVRSW